MNKFKQLLDYHFLFLFIGLVFGLQMVYVNPPWQTNDEDRHFYNAYALSNGQIGPLVKDGKIGLMMPEALANDVRSFQGIPFSDSVKIAKKQLSNLKSHGLNKKNSVFIENISSNTSPVGYIPAAIFVKIATVMNLSTIEVGYWGRIGSLLAYLLIVFFAIKTAPYFKPLLFLVALTPMSLYQGASVTYDSLHFALIYFMFALLLKFYFQSEKITIKQLLLFFCLALIHRFVKDGYLFLYFLPLFLGISKFEEKKQLVYFFIFALIASFLPGFIWSAYLQQVNMPSGISMQKDFLFDVSKNLQFHLSQPVDTIKDLLLNVFNQSQIWIIGSIGRFGYSYTKLPVWFSFLIIVCLILSASTEELKGKSIHLGFRIILLGIAIINILSLIAFFYLSSPVGASVIFGLQGRYFTPFLPFLFLAGFYINGHQIKIPYKHLIIPALSILILLYTSNFLSSAFFH